MVYAQILCITILMTTTFTVTTNLQVVRHRRLFQRVLLLYLLLRSIPNQTCAYLCLVIPQGRCHGIGQS